MWFHPPTGEFCGVLSTVWLLRVVEGSSGTGRSGDAAASDWQAVSLVAVDRESGSLPPSLPVLVQKRGEYRQCMVALGKALPVCPASTKPQAVAGIDKQVASAAECWMSEGGRGC